MITDWVGGVKKGQNIDYVIFELSLICWTGSSSWGDSACCSGLLTLQSSIILIIMPGSTQQIKTIKRTIRQKSRNHMPKNICSTEEMFWLCNWKALQAHLNSQDCHTWVAFDSKILRQRIIKFLNHNLSWVINFFMLGWVLTLFFSNVLTKDHKFGWLTD